MDSKDHLDLPDRLFIPQEVELPQEARGMYQTMRRDMLLPFKDGDVDAATAAILSNKLLQMAGGAVYDENGKVQTIHEAKLEKMDQLIEEANGQQVLVMLSNPDFMIRLLQELKSEQEQRRELERQKKEDAPKVLFADAVKTSRTSILVGELAKILKQNGVETGQTRLFSWLRDNGFLIKRKGSDYNMPTQKAMEAGLFEIKETAVTHADGHVSVNRTPKVTGKGQLYFVERFLSQKE